MKTVHFNNVVKMRSFQNGREPFLYLASEDGNLTGDYVPAEVARQMFDALRKISSGMGHDMLGTTSLDREDMQSIAQKAIQLNHRPYPKGETGD